MHLRLVLVTGIGMIPDHIDHYYSALRIQVGGRCLQVILPVLDVMKDIMKKGDVEISCRKLRIFILSQDCTNVSKIFLGRPAR